MARMYKLSATCTPMNNTIKFILISLFILAQLGCSDKSSGENTPTELNEELDLKETLKSIAIEIESRDTIRIQNITNQKGYASIISWSDSLKNESFINHLTRDLMNYHVAQINDYDTVIIVSLGKPDEILGATRGYIVLKKINNELKIDELRGGK